MRNLAVRLPVPPRCLTLLVVVLAALAPHAGRAQAPLAPQLLRTVEAAVDLSTHTARSDTRRARATRVYLPALDADTLSVELFPDTRFTVALARRDSNLDGSSSWSGHVPGVPRSAVTLVRSGGILQGSVRLAEAAFSIEPLDTAGLHVVREIASAAPGIELPPLVPDTAWLDPAAADRPFIDDGSVIDLLVVYTAAARAEAGGSDAAVRARINLGVAETNTAYANSGIIPRLRLVGAELVGYADSGDLAGDLQRLTAPADGAMDEVHARRDATGADLVQLIVGPTAGGACGVAWIMQTLSTSFAPLAFSVTAYPCISPNYTFGHELGHNMGSAHAPEDPNAAPVFSYSYGYKDPAATFRTIMAYPCGSPCPRVLHFSNPSAQHDGRPTGTATQDNARSIDDTRHVVSNFRPSREADSLLGAPGQFTITTTGTSAALTWTHPQSGLATSYVIEVGSFEGGSDISTLVAQGGATSYLVPSVDPGTYFVRVRGWNGAGPGAPSDTVTVVMTPAGRCIAPAGPPSGLAATVSGYQVSLSWSAPTTGGAVDAYVVAAGSAPGVIDLAFIDTHSTATSLTTTTLAGTYFVRVGARNPCGYGAASNEIALSTGPPGPPRGLTSAVAPGGYVSLGWAPPLSGAPLTHYVVEAGSGPGRADLAVIPSNGTATSYAMAAPPGLYFVRVRAGNSAGLGPPSSETVVHVP